MHSCDSLDFEAESSAIDGLTAEQKDRLTDILDRYLSGLESGVPPSREELLATHPDLAGTLRTYLAQLDELHDAAGAFGGGSLAAKAESPPEDDEKRLGDYRLLREIGRGGMGVVYEARQISLGRRVALKVLPFAAVLDSRQISRFKHEAQAAAQLDHPNIVSVFAVGMERGVHYYAMQFIDGQPLDRALAELQREERFGQDPVPEAAAGPIVDAANAPTVDFHPSTPGSLLTGKGADRQEYFRTIARLGIQAAEALQAAHEHGIVHRDIKPSNLLLDGDGKLWVTDFGLARCRTDAALTRTGDMIGTLRYMSPEQALGKSALVDERTDIYSLGSTLYELVALQPAFPGENGPGLLRRIQQYEPRPLRQLQPKVPADLETVIQKAMAKRREDRYNTARDLADDLRRVLEGKPTIARPPKLPERLSKWAQRHRGTVAAAAAVCVLAMLGMAISTALVAREKLKSDRNFALAEQRLRDAQEQVDFGTQLADRLAGVPGAEQVRQDLLRHTRQYYADFVEQAKDKPALRAELARTYNKIGLLDSQIGSNEEAVAAYETAVGLFEQLAAEHPREPDYQRQLAVSRNTLGLALARAGRTDAARAAYQEAIRGQQELAAGGKLPPEESREIVGELAVSHNNLATLEKETGQLARAEQSFHEAIRLHESAVEQDPDNAERLIQLAASLNNLGALYVARQPDKAAELYQKASTWQAKAAALRPDELKFKSDEATTCNNLGQVQSRSGQLAEAAKSYKRAVEIEGELARLAPAQKSYRHDLAVTLNNLGLTQSKLRQSADAGRSFRRALDLQEELVKQDPNDLELQHSLGGIYNNLGIVEDELHRTSDAAKSYKLAVEHQQFASSHAPQVARYRLFLSKHYYNYGSALRRLGRADEAARAALARRALWPNDPQHLFAVAEELALATKALESSKGGEMTAAECAEYAVETLRQATAAGWKPAKDHAWTESFAALKDHPGFASLVKSDR